jgi:hypothetical protein
MCYHADAKQYFASGTGFLGRCAVGATALLLAALLVGCRSAPSLQAGAMLPGTAFKMPQRYVVVTLPISVNSVLGRAASTPRGYDADSLASHAIAISYRLREVASWPIAVLGVNCIVYELPAEADLERLLAVLVRDSRVESAQPLSDFTIEAQSLEVLPNSPQ